MSPAAQQLLDIALTLPEAERLDLVDALLASQGPRANIHSIPNCWLKSIAAPPRSIPARSRQHRGPSWRAGPATARRTLG